MKLVVLNGPMQGLEFSLEGPIATIGRRSDCDVCLPLDPRISRRHAELKIEEGFCVLSDAGSGNGTFVGGVRVFAPTEIRTGDRIRVGRTFLKLAEETPAPAVPAGVRFVTEHQQEVTAIARADQPFRVETGRPEAEPQTVEALQRYLRVFHEFGESVSSLLELEPLLERLMDIIMEVTPAQRGFLMLVDEETNELRPQVVRHADGSPSGDITISRALVDRAIQERVAIVTSDAMQDERFRERASVAAFRIRSAICVPLIRHQKVLAVIHLDTQAVPNAFAEADLGLLTGLASQAAVAIENARLYTDLRKAYEELQQAQEQLLVSEKLSAIGTLSASIAHDVGNIVTPLLSLVELATADVDIDPNVRRLLDNQLPKLVAYTRRLLSFSADHELDLQPTDINAVVEGTLFLIRTEAHHKKVDVVFEPHPASPTVVADRTELERVLLNLTLNAIQAMENTGGTLTVEVGEEPDEVSIAVADTGPGIPRELLPRLFQPFFTTKESGTGMGLFSCKRIVEEEHGGVLELESRPGEGARFTVRLPKAAPEQVEQQDTTDSGSALKDSTDDAP